MITPETLLSCKKENLAELTSTLTAADLSQLVEWLNEKDDDLRYKSFLLLQDRSQKFDDVYPYWDTLVAKLDSDNSYQRSLGLMLLDILSVLTAIQKLQPDERISRYVHTALTGGILDTKAKRLVEIM